MPEPEFSIHGYNIVTLLKRLEAATSRLEDVTIFQENASKGPDGAPIGGSSASTGEKGLPTTAATAATADGAADATDAAAAPPKAIASYKQFVEEYVDPFVALSKKIDPVVLEQAEQFKTAVDEEGTFLWAASLSKKVAPTDAAFQEALKPTNEAITKVIEIKDTNNTSKFINNLNTVAEGVPALGWLCVGTPVSYIPDFKDAAQFWGNRILKANKGTNEDQVEWAKSFAKIFDGLKAFVKEYETTGPTWSANGGDFSQEYKKLSSKEVPAATSAATATATAKAVPAAPAPPAAGAGGPAPPPPPPPPPSSVFEAGSSSEPAGMNAVFSELNKGSDITKGLKKVDKSQMTHKNPALRASSTVPAAKPIPPKKPSSLSEKKAVATPAKPPTRELVDNKWMVTNFKSSSEPIVLEVDMTQSVFVSNCENIVVQLKGKVNAVTINSSKKVGIVIEKGISSVDIIKSSHVEVQIIDNVPTISADQTDSLTIYLSETSLNTEIYTSSTTALNVDIPDGEDMKELPAPEQLKHVYDPKTKKLVSNAVEHAG